MIVVMSEWKISVMNGYVGLSPISANIDPQTGLECEEFYTGFAKVKYVELGSVFKKGDVVLSPTNVSFEPIKDTEGDNVLFVHEEDIKLRLIPEQKDGGF